MKQISLKILVLFMLAFSMVATSTQVQAQCQNVSAYGTQTAPAIIGGTATIGCQYASEYGTWNTVVAGNTYRMTSTVGTDFCTVRSLSPGGAVVAFGVQPLVFTAPVSGTYYIHWNTNNLCGTQNTCRDVTMTLLAPPPTISSFSPASGCGNSTSVVITGTNFTGATAVTFGGVAAQSFVVNNATQITAVPASGNTGTISVTTLGGSGTSAGTFTVNTPPTVTVTASTNPICSGSSTTLTAVGANMGGGGSYLYNPGALAGAVQTVSPVTSTVYTVTATAVNGCTGTTSISISVTPIAAAPNPVTATPTTICPGGTSQLNSTSIVNATQTWYTVPSGGVAIGTSLSGANFPVTPAVTTTYYVETFENIPSGSQTFSYTGGLQTFTVPAGITSITVDAFGAQGGGNGISVGGLGGNIQTTLAVTGGQILNVYVGGQGLPGGPTAGGYNGGGASSNSTNSGSGGGASDVRVAPYALTDRLVVAGAGGGAGLNCGSNQEMGGMGGGLTGGTGWQCGQQISFVGLGGSQIAGGLQGNNQGQGCGQDGSLGLGGNGACIYGGGGGGGYYGGGGGGYGGGGGGSSYSSGPILVNTQGVRSGNGQVIISWTGSVTCPSNPRVPVTVTVNQPPVISAISATPANICSIGNAALSVTASLPVVPVAYCQPSTSCTFPDIITNVTFAGINRTSVCDAPGGGGYSIYNLPNPTINAGASYPISVTTGGDVEGAMAWIDYNQDGVFSPLEAIFNGFAGTNPATYNATANIPITAKNGTTRMRVRCTYNTNPNTLLNPPCTNVTFGETEDYLVTIVGGNGGTTLTWSPGTFLNNTTISNPTVTGINTTTTYTVTAADGAGCTSTSSVTITVNPNPTITATASTNPVCLGGSTTLTGGGATSYVWTGGVSNGVSFAPLVTDTYTVTGTDGNSCTGTTSITVDVVPALTTTITQSPAGLLCGVNPTLTAVSTGGGVPVAPAPGARYYIRDVEPWGGASNNTEMATVFGAYTTLDFAGANPATVFVPGTQFVFLEGSDGNANALNTYLTANLPVIENWVAAGGRLFLNAAPNQGGTINFGFGGTTCVYPGNFDNSVTANGAHPIVLGPALPTGTAYTGSSYAHAYITNGGTSIIDGIAPVLTEKAWGSGLVLFGGMTLTQFHQPSPNASNLRMNMLNYTANTPVGVSYTYVWQPGGATTPSIVAPSTGIYTVTVTSPSGCTSVATISVTINPAVTVSASASPTSICSGESATLTATGVATNYDWMPGALSGANVSVSPVASTIYTVTASDPTGCTSVSTVEVVVNPVPVVGAPTATPSTICEGSSSQLDIVLPSNPNNYLVSSIPFAPVTPIGPTNLGPTGDDNVSGAINIGFPFSFYGTPYTSFVISTNGFISFNPAAGAGCCQGGLLPSNFDENNVVALAWNDLNQGAGGSIEYYNLTSPNRMVIQYSGVPQYGGGGSPLTGQIILYENGNIETHTTSVLSDGSPQTCGVEDATGTFGTAAPGRNSVSWGATNESWLFAPEAATVSWTPSGTLNNPAISNPVATPAATTTYTATVANAYGCTATQTVTVTVNPAPVVSATATPSTTCNLTSVNPCATGAVTYVWTGGLTNCTPFVATTTDTYTVTGTDGAGCTGTSSVTVTVNPASGTLAPITSNQAQDHGDDFNINYYAANCDLIATVDDGAGGNVLGLTTSTVNVDATAGFHNGQPFVRRWYQITPTTNGSADVKLYINQTDFDDYNAAVVAPYLPLPTGPGDAAGIANIRITKNDDGGLGNNPIVITPAVSWNGTYWELSFNTPSFSQFRVHSVNPGNVPLPVTVTSFSGTKLESSDKLSWITSSEQNNAYFNLQHSTDGISFSTIAKVASKAPNGNSNTALSYTATNNKPALGHNYYRLQQVDIDNKVSVHAQIVDLIWGANGSTVSIYPNPTTDILNIDLYATAAQNTTVKLLDMSGRVIRQVQAKSAVGMNNIQLSLGEIASGVYTVQVYENNHLTHTSKVKKND